MLKGYKGHIYGHVNKAGEILEKIFWLIYISY